MANSVELVVDSDVWSHDVVAESSENGEEGDEPVGDAQEEVEEEAQVGDLTEDAAEAVEDFPVEHVDIVREAFEDLSNWSHVEEEVDWRAHHFREEAQMNTLAHLLGLSRDEHLDADVEK